MLTVYKQPVICVWRFWPQIYDSAQATNQKPKLEFMHREWSDYEVHREVGDIVQEFGLLKCLECAKAVKRWLKQQGINGIHIKITTADKDDFIVSDRWNNGRESITQNGTHHGIEVRGKVFDNLSQVGLPRRDWLQNFDCRGGRFNLEEIDIF